MYVVIFELTPTPSGIDSYFDIANTLAPRLQTVDGFISIERFQSVHDPNRFLSISYWRDEKSIKTWRTEEKHRNAQNLGRNKLFDNYRLRVASIVRDYSMKDREQAPNDY